MDPTTKDLDIWTFECAEYVQLAAAQALQDKGVVIPTEHKGAWNGSLKANGCFGLPVDWDYQETLSCTYSTSDQEYLFQLPRVFVECVNSLLKCTDSEGLFRKAGSVSRQKAIRFDLEEGASIPNDANVHDVASILKQYLRQLPDPLLTRHLSPVFETCVTKVPEGEQVSSLLLACLLLPAPNLQCLCVLMGLLKVVSEQKGSLMSSSSLAIIMAPNLLHSPTEDQLVLPSGNSLITQTTIIQKLIENSASIGRVPHKVGVASAGYKEVRVLHSSEDVVEDKKILPSSRCGGKTKKHRTSSISGIVLGFGNRLRQKGTAMFGGDHPTIGARKKGTVKRKGRSREDLLESGTAGKMKILNVEEIRHSLRNRRSANIPRPRPRLQRTHQRSPPSEPTVTTDFHMTPSIDFTKQAQSLSTCGAHVSDTEPTHSQSCEKQRQLQCDSLSQAAVMYCPPLKRKLSPMKPSNQSEFSTSQSDFALSASPLKEPPTFSSPKRITISPILAQVDSLSTRPSSVEYTPQCTTESQFSFSLPTPLDPLSVSHPLNERQGKLQSSNAKSPSLLVSRPSPRCSELDQAFLRTPFLNTNSPNLMDKISSEMAQRNVLSMCDSSQPWCTSYTPANIYCESLQPINESYRRAVCRGNAIGIQPTITGCNDEIEKQQLEHCDVSVEDTIMPYPRLSLKFDISSSSNNESISSANSASESTLEQHTKQFIDPTASACPSSSTFRQTRSSGKLASSLDRTKSLADLKSPRSKLSTRMKASPTARKQYDYSATLGIGESLMQARTGSSMKIVSPSRKQYSHSACLGITSLERKSLQRASKRAPSRTQNSKIRLQSSEADNSSSPEQLSTLYSPQKGIVKKSESDSSYTLSIDLQSPDSPAPALLKILEANVAQSQKEENAKRAVNLHRTPLPPVCTLARKALVDVRSNQQALSKELMKKADTSKPPLTPFKRVFKSPWISKPGKTTSTVGSSDASRAKLYEVNKLGPSARASKLEPNSNCNRQGLPAKENMAGNGDYGLSLTREGVEFREWIL